MAELENKEEKVEKIDKTHFIIEMCDAMKASVENAKKVRGEQATLVEYLEKDENNRFAELIDTFKKQLEDLDKQIATLETRVECMDKSIELINNNEVVKTFYEVFTDATGMFRQ